jgi:hypothetical protein
MHTQTTNPFQSIESAHDFVNLLTEMVVEAKQELEQDLQQESTSKGSSRLDIRRMALYSMEKLEVHMAKQAYSR